MGDETKMADRQGVTFITACPAGVVVEYFFATKYCMTKYILHIMRPI